MDGYLLDTAPYLIPRHFSIPSHSPSSRFRPEGAAEPARRGEWDGDGWRMEWGTEARVRSRVWRVEWGTAGRCGEEGREPAKRREWETPGSDQPLSVYFQRSRIFNNENKRKKRENKWKKIRVLWLRSSFTRFLVHVSLRTPRSRVALCSLRSLRSPLRGVVIGVRQWTKETCIFYLHFLSYFHFYYIFHYLLSVFLSILVIYSLFFLIFCTLLILWFISCYFLYYFFFYVSYFYYLFSYFFSVSCFYWY